MVIAANHHLRVNAALFVCGIGSSTDDLSCHPPLLENLWRQFVHEWFIGLLPCFGHKPPHLNRVLPRTLDLRLLRHDRHARKQEEQKQQWSHAHTDADEPVEERDIDDRGDGAEVGSQRMPGFSGKLGGDRRKMRSLSIPTNGNAS